MKSLASSLLGLVLIACGEGTEEDSQTQSLIARNAPRWPHIQAIPLCLVNRAAVSDEIVQDLRQITASQYARAGVSFTGWGDCTPQDYARPMVRMRFKDVYDWNGSNWYYGGGRSQIGAWSAGLPNEGGATLWINVDHSYPTGPAVKRQAIVTGTRNAFLHELGHAIGLMHEHTRTDYNPAGGECAAAKKEPNLKENIYYTYINSSDYDSIMSYCNLNAARLSAGDIAGIQSLYPELKEGLPEARRLAQQYIVKLKTINEDRQAFTQSYGVTVLHHYTDAFPGLSVQANDDQIEALARDPRVVSIEENKRVHINTIQNNATWGIDRIDAHSGMDGVYTYKRTGRGVHAYVVDTGIWAMHSEFKGRLGEGYSTVDDGYGTSDCNGHGTHVSATLGGATYGVAKDVIIHPVRVLDCEGEGDDAGLIAGIDWVMKNAQRPAVINISLGGERSAALDEAVQNAIRSGILVIAAAGNESSDACGFSPSAVKEALTVGATSNSDTRASYSNYGPCLDIFAPGSNITSAWRAGNRATKMLSGTSMAAPHVAGVASLYLEERPSASPAEITALIQNRATPDIVKSRGTGSPNLLLYSHPKD